MRFVGICGTPGTGKKTVAPLLAKRLGVPAQAVNSFAPPGASDVDPQEVRIPLLASTPRGAVVFGHLLPHVLRKGEVSFVAVLRCEPSTLRRRLDRRGYPKQQVTENVEAELIGVVLDECLRRFGNAVVHEYDTTSGSPAKTASTIFHDMESKPRAKGGWIDWTLDYGSSRRLRSLLEGARVPPAST